MTRNLWKLSTRSLSLALLFFAVSLSSAQAQVDRAPGYELFVGYSYLSLDQGESFDRQSLNGFNASITSNFNRYFGLVSDFGFHKGKIDAGENPVGITETDFKQFTYQFGPRVTMVRNKRSVLAVHALFGGARADTDFNNVNRTAFALDLGGSIDLRVTDKFSVRVAQPSLQLTRFNDESQKNFRYSAGVVFNFGRR